MGVRIVRADLADAGAIWRLQQAAFAGEARRYGVWDLPPLVETADRIRRLFGEAVFLKAVGGDGELVGSVRGRWIRPGVCHVERLSVRPERQGRGIGGALMRRLEVEFAEAERFELETGHQSAGSLHIYHRMGYEVVRREEISPALTLVYMAKPGPAGLNTQNRK